MIWSFLSATPFRRSTFIVRQVNIRLPFIAHCFTLSREYLKLDWLIVLNLPLIIFCCLWSWLIDNSTTTVSSVLTINSWEHSLPSRLWTCLHLMNSFPIGQSGLCSPIAVFLVKSVWQFPSFNPYLVHFVWLLDHAGSVKLPRFSLDDACLIHLLIFSTMTVVIATRNIGSNWTNLLPMETTFQSFSALWVMWIPEVSISSRGIVTIAMCTRVTYCRWNQYPAVGVVT